MQPATQEEAQTRATESIVTRNLDFPPTVDGALGGSHYSSNFPDILDGAATLDDALMFGEHPFDDLLFRPLGDYTGEQWDEAVNSVLDQMGAT